MNKKHPVPQTAALIHDIEDRECHLINRVRFQERVGSNSQSRLVE